MQDSLIHNPELSHLNPVLIPEKVAFWPATPGWYALAALLLILTGLLIFRQYRKWKQNQYRRTALARLSILSQQLLQPENRQAAFAELAELVKRMALKSFPREDVAGLSGDDWLRFLTKTGAGTNFTDDAGKLLVTAQYQTPHTLQSFSENQLHTLLTLVKKWIRGHHV